MSPASPLPPRLKIQRGKTFAFYKQALGQYHYYFDNTKPSDLQDYIIINLEEDLFELHKQAIRETWRETHKVQGLAQASTFASALASIIKNVDQERHTPSFFKYVQQLRMALENLML